MKSSLFRILLWSTLLALAANSVIASDTLVYSDGLKAKKGDRFRCGPTVAINIEAPNKGDFFGDREALRRLLDYARAALRLRCPDHTIQRIDFNGLVSGQIIYRGFLSSENKWAISGFSGDEENLLTESTQPPGNSATSLPKLPSRPENSSEPNNRRNPESTPHANSPFQQALKLIRSDPESTESLARSHRRPSSSAAQSSSASSQTRSATSGIRTLGSDTDIQGVWSGHYTCENGPIGATLSLNEIQSNGNRRTVTLSGVFSFYPLAENPNTPSGEAEIRVNAVFPGRAVNVAQMRWTNQPEKGHSIRAVSFHGFLSFDGQRIDGEFKLSQCGQIHLERGDRLVKSLETDLPVSPVSSAASIKERTGELETAPFREKAIPTALADATNTKQKCEVLLRWISKMSEEYPDFDLLHTVKDSDYPKVGNLYSDEHFVPVFGDSFDRLGRKSSASLLSTIRGCYSGVKNGHPEKEKYRILSGHIAYDPFNKKARSGFNRSVVSALAKEKRALIEWRNRILASIATLPNTKDSHAKLAQLIKQGSEHLSTLWPSEVNGFVGTLQAKTSELENTLAGKNIDDQVASVEHVRGHTDDKLNGKNNNTAQQGRNLALKKSLPEAISLAHRFVDRLGEKHFRLTRRADNHGAPPSWYDLDIRDNILNIEIYDALLHRGSRFHVFRGSDLHPFLSENDFYTPLQVAELVNEIVTYSYNKWFGKNSRTLSSDMAHGLFAPYEKDIKLAFKGFGRPGLDDPALQRRLEYEQTYKKPTPEFALKALSKDDLVILTGNDSFGHLPLVEKIEILNPILSGPIIGFAGNDVYEKLVLGFYEPYLANFGWWRAGELDDSSMNTWNGRYGPPSQNQLFHMFMRYNWYSLATIFDSETKKLFFSPGTKRLNYKLTYPEVMDKLDFRNQKKLQRGIKEMGRPSVNTYLIEARKSRKYRDRSYYFEIRHDTYLDYLKELEWYRNVKRGVRVRT